MSVSDYHSLRDEAWAIGSKRGISPESWYKYTNQQFELLVEHQSSLKPDEIIEDADEILRFINRIKTDFEETRLNTTARPGREYRHSSPEHYAEISNTYDKIKSTSQRKFDDIKPLYHQAKRLEKTVRPVLKQMQIRALLDEECSYPISQRKGRLLVLSQTASLEEKESIFHMVLENGGHPGQNFHNLAGDLRKADRLTAEDKSAYIAFQLTNLGNDIEHHKWRIEELLPFAPDAITKYALTEQRVQVILALAERQPDARQKTSFYSHDELVDALQSDVAKSDIPSPERNLLRQAQFRVEHPTIHRMLKRLDIKLDLSGSGVRIASIFGRPKPKAARDNAYAA